jgi:hypothetical protein
MSRELRDKAEIMMKELNEMLKPLREEINNLRSVETPVTKDSVITYRRV